MKIRSVPIGVKLTAWYFAMMAIGMSALGWLALAGMHRSVRTTVDEQLADRVAAVTELLQSVATDNALADEFGERAQLETKETLLQIRDEKGNWLYQTRWLSAHPLPESFHFKTPDKPFVNFKIGNIPLRVTSSVVSTHGHTYSIQAAVVMDDFNSASERFTHTLLVVIPGLLAAASFAGYWMSRKALAPVDQITRAAQEITVQNLSARVNVPDSEDELHRLATTFNAMLERIERSLKRITQFTADASHELRTPVSIMRTRTELALRKVRTQAEYQQIIAQLNEELVQLSELVERLMLLARTDTAAVDMLRRTRVDLTRTTREALSQIEPLMEKRQLELKVTIPDEHIWCIGDPQFLHRLFVILLDNAVKYTPATGKIVVCLSSTKDQATFIVTDTGIGIAPADLSHIFERFYRADKARSRESGGAGLGLAIGRWIAEAHGGTISAQSALGKGSEFKVSLPLSSPASRLLATNGDSETVREHITD